MELNWLFPLAFVYDRITKKANLKLCFIFVFVCVPILCIYTRIQLSSAMPCNATLYCCLYTCRGLFYHLLVILG